MSNAATATATVSLTEYEAVKKAMQGYIDGCLEGRSDRMRPSFHPAASFFGHYNGTLLAGSIQSLFDWVDQNGPATGTGRSSDKSRSGRRPRSCESRWKVCQASCPWVVTLASPTFSRSSRLTGSG